MSNTIRNHILIRRQSPINHKSLDTIISSIRIGHPMKNLVSASPCLKCNILDFCLQLNSSSKVNFSISVRRFIYSNFSSTISKWVSPLTSKALSLLHNCCFLIATLPNSVSFHHLRSTFKAKSYQLLSQYITRNSLEQIRCPPAIWRLFADCYLFIYSFWFYLCIWEVQPSQIGVNGVFFFFGWVVGV